MSVRSAKVNQLAGVGDRVSESFVTQWTTDALLLRGEVDRILP